MHSGQAKAVLALRVIRLQAENIFKKWIREHAYIFYIFLQSWGLTFGILGSSSKIILRMTGKGSWEIWAFFYYGSYGALTPHLRKCLQTPGVLPSQTFYISSLYWCMAIKPFLRQHSLSPLTTALGTKPPIRRFAHPALPRPGPP